MRLESSVGLILHSYRPCYDDAVVEEWWVQWRGVVKEQGRQDPGAAQGVRVPDTEARLGRRRTMKSSDVRARSDGNGTGEEGCDESKTR